MRATTYSAALARSSKPFRRRPASWILAAGLASSCVAAPSAWGAPGQLDPEFYGQGYRLHGYRVSGNDVAVTSQRIATIGTHVDQDNRWQMYITRFASNGQFDTGFSADGHTSLERGEQIAIDDLDRTVVSGATSSGLVVGRFLRTGELDPSFGASGVSEISAQSLGTSWISPKELAVQPSGHTLILLKGDPRVIRLTPQGTVDRDFGESGILTINGDSGLSELAVDSEGTFAVAVGAIEGTPEAPERLINLYRFQPDGTALRGFGINGKMPLTRGDRALPSTRLVAGVALHQNGQVTVAARPSYDQAYVWRVNADGRVDPAFDGDGFVSHPLKGEDLQQMTAAVDSAGGVFLVVGEERDVLSIHRLSATGAVDSSFGDAGIGRFGFTRGCQGGYNDLWPHGIQVQPDGKPVVMGTIRPCAYNNTDFGQFVVRFQAGARTPPPGRPPRPVRRYVALGDSVAAGEGLNYGWEWMGGGPGGGYWKRDSSSEPAWNNPTPACHRSLGAFPWDVMLRLGLTGEGFRHFACTGATAWDGVLTRRQQSGNDEPPQLGRSGGDPGDAPNAAYDAANPDLVSVTLGADDVRFADFVGECYLKSGNTVEAKLADCDDEYNKAVAGHFLDKQRESLATVLDEIRDRGLAAGKVPLVALTTYYDPFPKRYPSSPKDCRDISIFQNDVFALLSSDEVDFLRDGLFRLNDNIRTVARSYPNVVVVEPPQEFDEHRFCSEEGPWVHGPSLRLHEGSFDNPAPFHPTDRGQEALGEVVAQAFRGAQQVPKGQGVEVGTPGGARLRFDEVTQAGAATVAPMSSDDSPPNTGFRLAGEVFQVATSATWRGSVTVSFPSPTAQDLYHYTSGAWRLVPSRYENGYVIATVTGLSPFALGTPVPAVTASFVDSGGGIAPANVNFDATASGVQGGSIASYEWDFGDGSTGTSATPAHTYATSGTFAVKLRVTSDQGAVDEATRSVTVSNADPTAALAGPDSAQTNAPVSFSATGSSDPNGTIAERVWDFGDGSQPVEGEHVQHAYDRPGTYTATLTVLDNEGASATATKTVTVTEPPTPPAPGPGSGSQPGPTSPAPGALPVPGLPAPPQPGPPTGSPAGPSTDTPKRQRKRRSCRKTKRPRGKKPPKPCGRKKKKKNRRSR